MMGDRPVFVAVGHVTRDLKELVGTWGEGRRCMRR